MPTAPSYVASIAATILVLAAPSARLAAQEAATVVEAATAIDLNTFPLPPDAMEGASRRLAGLAYDYSGPPRSAYGALAKTLGELGWKELPGGHLDDLSCSGSFGKGGFTLAASALPARGDNAAGRAAVRLTNLGNIDLTRLPIPAAARLMYSFPTTTAYTTDRPADEVVAALNSLLIAQGWAPYGRAGDARFFRKNAVKLTARTVAPPAQPGKTILQYSSELMSVELPAPADSLAVAYADSTKALSLEVATTAAALAAFYKVELARLGWEPTTEAPIQDASRELLIFRNPAKDLLTLEMHSVGGKLRANLEHRTAAEAEAEIRQAEAAEAGRKAGSEQATRKAAEAAARARIHVAVPVPVGARNVERRRDALNFRLTAGQALPAARAICDAATRDGWMEKRRPRPLDAMAGSVSLEKGSGVTLVIVYIDAGLGDAEIKVTAFGADITAPADQ